MRKVAWFSPQKEKPEEVELSYTVHSKDIAVVTVKSKHATSNINVRVFGREFIAAINKASSTSNVTE